MLRGHVRGKRRNHFPCFDYPKGRRSCPKQQGVPAASLIPTNRTGRTCSIVAVASPCGHCAAFACMRTSLDRNDRLIRLGYVIARAICPEMTAVSHSCSAGIVMMSTPPSILSATSICTTQLATLPHLIVVSGVGVRSSHHLHILCSEWTAMSRLQTRHGGTGPCIRHLATVC